jgi:hypothetical protein
LIDYFLKERPKKNQLSKFQYYGRTLKFFAIENLGLKDFYDQMKYVSKKPLTKKLWVFIFDELKRKSDLVDIDPDMGKKIYSARGDWVLQNNWTSINESSNLMHYIADFGYDESLILWHIATELHHHKEISHEENIDRREFCKILSEYMLYLLVMQPTLMSVAAGIGQKRFFDTCNDARNMFIGTNQGQEPYQEHKQNKHEAFLLDLAKELYECCKQLCCSTKPRRPVYHICLVINVSFWHRGSNPNI